MRVYTVHAPPERGAEEEEYLDRFVFVREGFRWWAFLVPAIWMLVNRTWWALIGYLVLAVGLGLSLDAAGVGDSSWPLFLGLNLIVGFEADALKRWSLRRKGWRTVGLVAARDEAEAEHSFFSRFSKNAAVLRGEVMRPNDMIGGLFPEPGR